MTALYYEDWTEDRTLVTRARTVFDHDVGTFVGMSGMFEELFLNREYYENRSLFKRRIAPGLLALSIAEGLAIQEGWIHGTGLAFLGLDEMRITAPVAVGDTIHVEVTAVERRETRHADRGIVKTRHTVKNQHGDAVMTFLMTRMVAKRVAVEAPAAR